MGNNEDYFVKRPVSGNSAQNPQRNPDRRITDEGQAPARRVRPQDENAVQKRKEATPPSETEKKKGFLATLMNGSDCAKLPEGYKVGSVDMAFLVILAIIIALGTVMVFSSSHAYAVTKYGDGYHFLRNQLLVVAFGCVLIALVALFPLKTYAFVTWAVYGVAVALLVAVLLFGASEGEAKRWIYLGPMSFQPSELGKTAVVMMLALYMSKYREKIESKKLGESFRYGILAPVAIFGLIVGLVIFEHHFSGVIIICAIAACMMFFGGTRILYIAIIGAIGVVGVWGLITLTPYANARLQIWQNPWSDLMGKGWQTVQGLYSIASGGIFGVGLGNSHQKYGYVSEPQNDFVFTIACEELGFVGAVAIIFLFALLIWRGFSIARHSPNRFTYLLVLGIISKIAIQVILNIAVVTNTIPNTGIPLPFFSSGGSSLLVLMAEMGVVLSVSRYSKQKK